MRRAGLLRPGDHAHHIARRAMAHDGLRRLFERAGLDVEDIANGVGLRHHTGHNRTEYDELVYERLRRFDRDGAGIKRELRAIGRELQAIDRAGRYRGWCPFAQETRFNTVNEWVRRNLGE